MFGSKKTSSFPAAAHIQIQVETIDGTEDYEFEEGGVEPSYKFLLGEQLCVVTKSDGGEVVFPTVNLIRVEAFTV